MCLHAVLLQGLPLQCCRGVYITRRDGVQRMFVPVPAAYIADLPEAASIFHIAPHPAAYSSSNSLIHKTKLGDPDHAAPPRHQKHMHQVCNDWVHSLLYATRNLLAKACVHQLGSCLLQVMREASDLREIGDTIAARQKLAEYSLISTDQVRGTPHLHNSAGTCMTFV